MVTFFFIQTKAFSCPDIRYLHGTFDPYPPPRLILSPVTLVSKNDLGWVKNKEIHLDIAKGICPATVDRITCFTRQYEDGDINGSLEVKTEKLQDIMIRNRQHKKITDYFNL